jgi:lipopolysaccharide transport system ATP-binding protein
LSGRENIYLNGAILGMGRKEIGRKFDEIVDFAEIGNFIDTPVKHYSSGMYVRLAFAVAAHLDVDLLVIDEVLAVGDIEFQRKCMARMGTVSSSGRTVLFVSHNLGAVEQLCHSAIVLDKGRIVFRGGASESVRHFHGMCESSAEGPVSSAFSGNLKDRISITGLSVSQQGSGESRVISPREPIRVMLHGESRSDFRDLDIAIAIFHEGTRLFSCHDAPVNTPLAEGEFSSEFEIPPRLLRPGRYSLAAGARRVGRDDWIWGTDLAYFDVVPEWDERYLERDTGIICVPSIATRTQLPRGTRR